MVLRSLLPSVGTSNYSLEYLTPDEALTRNMEQTVGKTQEIWSHHSSLGSLTSMMGLSGKFLDFCHVFQDDFLEVRWIERYG